MCLNYKSESGCTYGEKCRFRHTEADGQPSKKSKQSGGKGSVALLKDSTPLGCVSQDSCQRKSILRKDENLGSNHTVKFSKGAWHHIQIRVRQGPSRDVIQKCQPHERAIRALPRFEVRTQDETLHQERCQSGTWRKYLQAQECRESHVLSSY